MESTLIPSAPWARNPETTVHIKLSPEARACKGFPHVLPPVSSRRRQAGGPAPCFSVGHQRAEHLHPEKPDPGALLLWLVIAVPRGVGPDPPPPPAPQGGALTLALLLLLFLLGVALRPAREAAAAAVPTSPSISADASAGHACAAAAGGAARQPCWTIPGWQRAPPHAPLEASRCTHESC